MAVLERSSEIEIVDASRTPDVIVELRHPSCWKQLPKGRKFPAVVVVAQAVSPCSENEAFEYHADDYVDSTRYLVDAVLEAHRGRRYSVRDRGDGVTPPDRARSAGGFAVGLRRLLVAVGMKVLDPLPHAFVVDIADDLLEAQAGLELHALTAMSAVDHAAGLDDAKNGATRPFPWPPRAALVRTRRFVGGCDGGRHATCIGTFSARLSAQCRIALPFGPIDSEEAHRPAVT